MFKFSLTLTIVLLSLVVGGFNMANAQEKPPLLGTSPAYQQPATLPQDQPPPPPAQMGTAPPPPPEGPMPPPTSFASSPQLQEKIAGKAPLAVSTAKRAKSYLVPGKVWTMRAPAGEIEIKAGILYNGMVVAIIHLTPQGVPLPLGIRPSIINTQVPLETIRANLTSIIKDLEVLNGAEYREPENAWIVPMAYHGMIVSNLKIYLDGFHIIPDYPGNQEMQMYGR